LFIKNAFRSFSFLQYYYFNLQVLAGRYEGENGIVIRHEEKTIALFSNIALYELEVKPKYLQLMHPLSHFGNIDEFQWGDLVDLNAQTVGVIVQLKRENVHVLSMHGEVVQVKPHSILKHPDRKAMALDFIKNVIQKKNFVKVIDGPHASRDGEIKHLYRSFAFLYSQMFVDNSGIFICKTKHLQLFDNNNASIMMPLAAGFETSYIAMYDSPLIPSKIKYSIILLYMSML